MHPSEGFEVYSTDRRVSICGGGGEAGGELTVGKMRQENVKKHQLCPIFFSFKRVSE